MVAPGRGNGRGFGSVRGFGLSASAGRSGLVREDRLGGLAGEQALELVLVDGLALDEELGDLVEVVHVFAENAQRAP